MRPRTLVASLAAALAGAAVLAVTPFAAANEALPDGPATLADFVRASVPQWNFARANNNDPCWPESPFDTNGNPVPGGRLTNWPDSDGGCAPHGAPFPTYYSVQRCGSNNDDIRVTFTIYQGTSGFQPSGHSHDFEGIAVTWRRNGTQWTRDRLAGSAHGGYNIYPWSNVESWNLARDFWDRGSDLPRVYVGFGSHAMYNTQGGLKDVLSAYTSLEYRQADYPVWADQGGGLVEVPIGGELYQKFKALAPAWGSANSNPAERADRACSI